MEYGLTQMILGPTVFVPIAKADYEAIKAAVAGLLEYTAIEEKFDLVAENHIEFETSLLHAGINHMLQGSQNHAWFQQQRRLFNRRLMNYLSSTRAYVDHMPQHFKKIFDGSLEVAASIKSKHYNLHIGYRAMDALRNFAQHAGDPIHGETYGASWDEGRTKLCYVVNVYLRPEDLRAQGSFSPKRVLQELESLGENIDLKYLVRDHMEGLWGVHSDIRKECSSRITEWIGVLKGAIERFRAEAKEDSAALALAAVARENDVLSEKANLVPDFLSYIEYLGRKNRSGVGFSRRYISSE